MSDQQMPADYAALAERWGMTPAQIDAWPPDVVHWAASLATRFARRDAEEPASGSTPQDDAVVDCHLAHPVGEQDALAWASTAEWFFKSYYKYDFTFESSGFLAMPDEHEAHEFTATATVGGDAPEIYRFKVEDSEPMTWDEISYAGIPYLTIRDQDGTVLITVAGDDA